MPTKEFVFDEQIKIIISKRASSRRIRLTVGSDGKVRVSIPRYVPYIAGIEFAKSKLDWIKQKRPLIELLEDGRQVGKSHHLILRPAETTSVSTRLTELEAIVSYPKDLDVSSQAVQSAARIVIKRALKKQAETLLPIRLKQLAESHGYVYSSVKIKSLKTRWGSCDSHRNITLNLYLMELPWELIDYVLVHELHHTRVMQHGPKFWDSINEVMPNSKQLRKQLKSHPTLV